jgi:hypothetical protein
VCVCVEGGGVLAQRRRTAQCSAVSATQGERTRVCQWTDSERGAEGRGGSVNVSIKVYACEQQAAAHALSKCLRCLDSHDTHSPH